MLSMILPDPQRMNQAWFRSKAEMRDQAFPIGPMMPKTSKNLLHSGGQTREGLVPLGDKKCLRPRIEQDV